MNSMIKLAMFVVGFCVVFGLTTVVSAQQHGGAPAGYTDICFGAFNSAYSDGVISSAEAVQLTQTCVSMDLVQIGFFEDMADRLNGGQSRPTFGGMSDVINFFNGCHESTEIRCPNPGTVPPPVRPRTPRRLVVEGRGPHHMEGRGWHREVVCENGTIGVPIDWRHSRTEGESRRHEEPGITLVIIHCVDAHNTAAPPIVIEDGEDDLEEPGNNFTFLTNYCSPTLPEGAVRDAQWAGFCNTFNGFVDELSGFSGDLGRFRAQLTGILARLGTLEGGLSSICGIDPVEYPTMTRAQVVAACSNARRAYLEDQTGSAAEASRFRLETGIAGELMLHTEARGVVAPYIIAFAEGEFLLGGNPGSLQGGFYVRGEIGWGSLMDKVGQYNLTTPIGSSGVWGLSGGGVIRFNDTLALDLGLAFDSSLVAGMRGDAIYEYAWHQLGAEARIRISPVRHVSIDIGLTAAWSHSEVEVPNTDPLVGRDGFGGTLQVGLGLEF